jgi:hypothetical protein
MRIFCIGGLIYENQFKNYHFLKRTDRLDRSFGKFSKAVCLRYDWQWAEPVDGPASGS